MKKLTYKEKQEAHAWLAGVMGSIKPRDNILFALFFLLLAYVIASRAIDTGSLIEYVLAIAALGFVLSNLIGFSKKKLGKARVR